MEKVILVDGNNLMFRSYYATAYNGNLMTNSKGQATNALYGFVNMMQKIIKEENPSYLMVAFDIGKNFRKEKYDFYKEGRQATPDELKSQMKIARKLLDAMGIKYFELEPFEADDIIGTFASWAESDPNYEAVVISSDKDLLQLISNQVEVKLLKTKDYIRYNPANFKEDWGFDPIHMIDYKALAGDASDRIPGVKGIGDKTAISLLTKYKDLEDIYAHIDEIKGATQKKLLEDKDNAFMSKEMATIYKEVPLQFTVEELRYKGPNEEALNEIYEDLEFYSFLKHKKKSPQKEFTYLQINDAEEIEEANEYAYYIEVDDLDYHKGAIVGMAVATKKHTYYVPELLIEEVLAKLEGKVLDTYDYKKNIYVLTKLGIKAPHTNFDTMIASYLLEENTKEDIAYLMHQYDREPQFFDEMKKNGFDKNTIAEKARFIFDTRDDYIEKIKLEEMYPLLKEVEMPLTKVLAAMEWQGVKCDATILKEYGEETKEKIGTLEKEIYSLAGETFNIGSPKQLGVILFEKLALPYAKKTKTGYATDVDTLKKLMEIHPIIPKVMEYRNLSKLLSTYLEGLIPYIEKDGKIHTIYKQNLTRTGRLSSIDPNMQNIPSKEEEGRKIKKAFTPENDVFISCDYSQMELRLLAHMSNCKELIEAFESGEDIHTMVAASIHNISPTEVTPYLRKTAKAVVFGIVYGISGFGLSENLQISPKEAKGLIDAFYLKYPGVKTYMDNVVKEAYELGGVRTLMNRKRTIQELQNKNFMIRQSGERIALNTPIQGTCADMVKKAMVRIDEEFRKQGIASKMVLQVHDELIIDTKQEEKEKVIAIVQEAMKNVIQLNVPVLVSCDVGTDWYETK